MTKNEKFMDIALKSAEAALSSGEFPVGCVIADSEQVISSGTRTGSFGPGANEIAHAEITALKRLSETAGAGKISDLTLYSTLEPCLMCFGAAIISGIHRIVFAYEDVMGGGTACDCGVLPCIYRDREIFVTAGVRRQESLRLFKKFFENPQNDYLRGTLLCEHTLKQERPLKNE
ncbi:MAG: nucleoside deaminase [Deltaproteobacteria bacterium]|nr:nucleoside deaminase [Deltaproteobacteria bacterium]